MAQTGEGIQGAVSDYQSGKITYLQLVGLVVTEYMKTGMTVQNATEEAKGALNPMLAQNPYGEDGFIKVKVVTPGVTPPPIFGGGQTGGAGGPGVAFGGYKKDLTPDQRYALGEDDPYAAYLRRLNIPGVGQNMFQSWQANEQQPMYATFGAAQALHPKTTANDWNTYMGTGGPLEQRKTALGLFNEAAALPNQGNAGQSQSGLMDTLGTGFTDFMKNVLAAQYNPTIRKNLLSNLGGLQAQYNATTGGAGGAGADQGFVNFLKQYYNL